MGIDADIFGLSYFLLPMASGRPLYSDTLPYMHFALANAGLAGMAAVWTASRFPNSPVSPRMAWPFGALMIVSVWLFIFNIAMTVFGG